MTKPTRYFVRPEHLHAELPAPTEAGQPDAYYRVVLEEQVKVLEAKLKVYVEWDNDNEECFVASHATLTAEVDELKAEVREWLCVKCRFVYPGPPAEGFACVQCPKCHGDCGPRLNMERRELTAQVEGLKVELAGNIRERENIASALHNDDPISDELREESPEAATIDDLQAAHARVREALERSMKFLDSFVRELSDRDYYCETADDETPMQTVCTETRIELEAVREQGQQALATTEGER